jgi:hypothetical protein
MISHRIKPGRKPKQGVRKREDSAARGDPVFSFERRSKAVMFDCLYPPPEAQNETGTAVRIGTKII